MNNPDKLLEDIGKRIRNKRKEMGLTQEQFAEKADISVSMLSTAERGVKAIRPENIIKISEALGMSCDYLLKGNVNSLDTAQLECQLSGLTYEQKQRATELLNTCIKVLNS